MVIIPKGCGGDFWEIGLAEVLWKTTAGLLDHRFILEICCHVVLHGFQEGSGTGTATLKAKLLQHITAMREVVLH